MMKSKRSRRILGVSVALGLLFLSASWLSTAAAVVAAETAERPSETTVSETRGDLTATEATSAVTVPIVEAETQPETGMSEAPKPTVEAGAQPETGVSEAPRPATDSNAATQTAKNIVIRSSQGAVVHQGEKITLTATLTGFEGLALEFQWQYNAGQGWQDVDNGHALSYTFEAGEENLAYQWRLKVKLA